jgi:hypothetical protein
MYLFNCDTFSYKKCCIHFTLHSFTETTLNQNQERTTNEKPVNERIASERSTNQEKKYLPLLFTEQAIKFNRSMEEKKSLLKKAT